MSRILAGWEKFIQGLGKATVYLSTVSLIVITIACILVPIMRLFGFGLTILQEMPPEFAGYIAFPLMGILLKMERHVSVDIIKFYLRGKALGIVAIVISLFTILGGLMLMYAALIALGYYWKTGQAFDTEIPIPNWIIELGLVIGSAILVIFAVEMFVRSILGFRHPAELELGKETD